MIYIISKFSKRIPFFRFRPNLKLIFGLLFNLDKIMKNSNYPIGTIKSFLIPRTIIIISFHFFHHSNKILILILT